MWGPSDDEQIRYVILNVKAMKGLGGLIRDYDLLFTEKGVLFANTVGAWGSVKQGVGAQFGWIGYTAAQRSIEKDKANGRNLTAGLSLKEMLQKSEKSFYIPYMEVQLVTLKKGLTGIGKMSFLTPEGKWNCEFSKDQIDIARAAISERLATKMEG